MVVVVVVVVVVEKEEEETEKFHTESKVHCVVRVRPHFQYLEPAMDKRIIVL